MGRSNKEARPNQIPDGGGAVNWGGRTGAGTKVKPKEPELESKMQKVLEAVTKGSSGGGSGGAADDDMGESSNAYDKIGKAGADIAKEYKRRKAAKSAESSSSSSSSSAGSSTWGS